MPGHVGVYIGNGQVIESKGIAYGVVQTKLAGRGWQKWFWIKEIDYSGKPETCRYPLIPMNTLSKKSDKYINFLPAEPKNQRCPAVPPDVVSVKFNGQDSRGYLFEIKALKPGLSTITAKISTKTAEFKASFGCQLDTHGTYKCKVEQQYTFLCRSVRKPDIMISDGSVLGIVSTSQDNRGHLFTIKAKSQGQAVIEASLDNFKDSFTVEVI